MLSMPHLIVLFVVALIIFGPQKLPELARMLGKATAEFRKMTGDFRYALEEEVRELDRQTRIREAEAAAASNPPQPPPPPEPSPYMPVPMEAEGIVPHMPPPVETEASNAAPSSADPHAAAIASDPDKPAQEKPSDDHAAV
jgi:sec-independent protein translocase protein TatB